MKDLKLTLFSFAMLLLLVISFTSAGMSEEEKIWCEEYRPLIPTGICGFVVDGNEEP